MKNGKKSGGSKSSVAAKSRARKMPRLANGQFAKKSTKSTGRSRSKRTSSSKKSVAKFKKSFRGKILKYGVSWTNEFGDELESTRGQQVITLGHSTANISQLQSVFAATIFKKLMYKAGIAIDGLFGPYQIASVANGGINPTCRIFVYYLYGAAQPRTRGVEIFIPPGPVDTNLITPIDFVNWFCSVGRPWFGSTEDIEFQYMSFSVTDTSAAPTQFVYACPTTLWLERGRFNVEVTSTLKYQNRTSNFYGPSTQVVDRAPLFGKMYEGRDNGPHYKADDASNMPNFFSDPNGLIHLAGSVSPGTQVIREPPQPTAFSNVQKYGAVKKFMPGDLRSSVISTKKSMGFNDLFRILFQYWTLDSVSLDCSRTLFGNYRMFIMEKYLQPGTEDTGNLKVAYQVNTFTAMGFSEGRSQESTTTFTSDV